MLADAGEIEANDVALLGIGILDGLDAVAAQAGIELPLIGAETGRIANQRGGDQPAGHDGHDNQHQPAQNRAPITRRLLTA